MGRLNDELTSLREDIDSLRNTLELAGVIPPREDDPADTEPATDPDADDGASDTAGEPETGTPDAAPASGSPDPARETAVNVTAEDRETRETE